MVRNNILSDDPSYHHNVSLMLLRGVRDNDIYMGVLYSFSGEKFENRAKLNLPNPFQEGSETPYRFHHFDILNLGGLNDFICVKCYLRRNHEHDVRFALWNPTTDEFKVIHHSPNRFQLFGANGSHDVINFHSSSHVCGFGNDSRTDDYKMINYVMFSAPFPRCIGYKPLGDMPEPFWKMHSLRSNSWRELDIVMPITQLYSTKDKVHMNGMCHWRCIIMHSDSEFESKLVSFDLNKEVFFTTPIPSDIDDSSPREECTWKQKQLVVLNGYIALITYEEQMTTCNISILGKLSVKESWIKLFIVGPLHCVEEPFGIAKGKIIFGKKEREINWFDLRTQMIEVLDLEGEYCNIAVYKEDLLPIGGINK